MAEVTVTNVVKRYGNAQVIHGVNVEIANGEFVILVGPSGCGKSTLLDVVAGLAKPTGGSIAFEGKPVAGQVPDGIGVVFQEDASFPWLTVTDNIAFGLRQTRLDENEIVARVDHALRLMGLTEFATAYPVQLSGGMRQRVCLARTLVQRPRVILLDEPFGALDSLTRAGMQQWLVEVWEQHRKTILPITHDVDEALCLSDRVYVRTPRPGRVELALEVDLPRPRSYELITSEPFVRDKQLLLEHLGMKAAS